MYYLSRVILCSCLFGCLDTITLEISTENDNFCFMPSVNILFCIALKLIEVNRKLEVVSGWSESILFSLAEQSE